MNLTQQAIKFLSTEDLRAALKEDLDPDVHDMITYELFEIRETT
jgi:predicted RecB family endonuclease|tara:strand:+ start:278 stop:409 length:132 start_codon:yes stop_codon:yes gene_type:complete